MLSIRKSNIVKFMLRNRFRREIIAVILLKILAIFIIWGLFFSHPVSRQLNKPALVDHYIKQTHQPIPFAQSHFFLSTITAVP